MAVHLGLVAVAVSEGCCCTPASSDHSELAGTAQAHILYTDVSYQDQCAQGSVSLYDSRNADKLLDETYSELPLDNTEVDMSHAIYVTSQQHTINISIT